MAQLFLTNFNTEQQGKLGMFKSSRRIGRDLRTRFKSSHQCFVQYEEVSKSVPDSVLRGAGWKLLLLMRDHFSSTKCLLTSLIHKYISQHGMGLKASLGRGGRDRVWGACVCVVFRGMKLLFIFFCLHRINSVTSLSLLF